MADFLMRDPEDGVIKRVKTEYSGPVPEFAIEKFNLAFLHENAGSGFYPCKDAMDVYQDGIIQLEKRARRMPVLTRAKSETYWKRTVDGILRAWCVRNIKPMRERYREYEKLYRGKKGAVGVDSFDVDNWDPTELGCSPAMARSSRIDDRSEREELGELADEHETGDETPRIASMYEYAEMLRSPRRNPYREIVAKRMLAAVRAAMLRGFGPEAEPALKAFDAYIDLDGNLFAVANTLEIPKSTFYRRWLGYIAMARVAWENLVVR